MAVSDLPINNKMLEWARKEAHLNLEDAALRAHLKDIKTKEESLSPASRIEKWEQGKGTPSFAQLEKIAKAYRRPVITFFLPEPPKKEKVLVDFRAVKNNEAKIAKYEPEFSALVRQSSALQKSIREILRQGDSDRIPFIGSASIDSPPLNTASIIGHTLDYDPLKIKGIRGAAKLFALLRNKAESKGIFVIVQGDLGSVHSQLDHEVFRGFTLSDDFAPLIVINPNDSKTANVFTLMHELCHLWLGDTGVSNWNSLNLKEPRTDIRKEEYCDKVAAEILAPKEHVLEKWELLTIGYDADTVIRRIASQLHISPIVVARRLLEFNKITTSKYWEWYNEYQEEWKALKEQIKQKKTKPPGYKARVRYKYGAATINTVLSAVGQGRVSDIDASGILGVKINNFARIL